MNELRERLVEVWAGLQQNMIDDAIDQWRRRLCAYVRARGEHFEYLLWLHFSHLRYGSWSSLKSCWFIVKQDVWFRLLLVFLFLAFHKVVWQHIWSFWCMLGSLLKILLQVSYWMCRWKNCENRSIFSKEMDKSIVSPFFDSRCRYKHPFRNLILFLHATAYLQSALLSPGVWPSVHPSVCHTCRPVKNGWI